MGKLRSVSSVGSQANTLAVKNLLRRPHSCAFKGALNVTDQPLRRLLSLALFADVTEKSPVWDGIWSVWAILPGERPMPTVSAFSVAGRSFAYGS